MTLLEAGRPPSFWAPLLCSGRPAAGCARCTTGCPTPVRPTGPQHPKSVQCRVGMGRGPGREKKQRVISWPGRHSPRNAHAPAQAAPTGPSLPNPPGYDRGSSCEVLLLGRTHPSRPRCSASLSFLSSVCASCWLAVSHPSLDCRPLHDKLELFSSSPYLAWLCPFLSTTRSFWLCCATSILAIGRRGLGAQTPRHSLSAFVVCCSRSPSHSFDFVPPSLLDSLARPPHSLALSWEILDPELGPSCQPIWMTTRITNIPTTECLTTTLPRGPCP